nr:MAG TPA: hypothetical protein [Caudoviricetes sp.]
MVRSVLFVRWIYRKTMLNNILLRFGGLKLNRYVCET